MLDIPTLPEDEDPPKDENYLLGRFCHKRTSLYHRLHFFHIHMLSKVKVTPHFSLPTNTAQSKVHKHPDADNVAELLQDLLDNGLWIGEVLLTTCSTFLLYYLDD